MTPWKTGFSGHHLECLMCRFNVRHDEQVGFPALEELVDGVSGRRETRKWRE
jgi:hypothetical protein